MMPSRADGARHGAVQCGGFGGERGGCEVSAYVVAVSKSSLSGTKSWVQPVRPAEKVAVPIEAGSKKLAPGLTTFTTRQAHRL